MLERTLVPFALVVTLSACGGYDARLGAAEIGITPGGSQDIGFARDVIAAGEIPDQEHFTAEGLFSEHDLPLSGEACEAVLCPRTAATIHRPFDGDDKVLVQLGFGTNITADSFAREDLDVVLLVDTSGSMSGEPLQRSKDGMLALLDQLGPDDRAGLVEFGRRARVLERSRDMDARGKEKLREAIEELAVNGSTDMEAGMREAYAQFQGDWSGSQRLMIFSDAQPNTGLTDESDFVRLVRESAEDDVGTTFFGIGPNLGTELADVISKVRGGSFHFLSEDSVERLFVDEFDYLVTPVAYDLEVTMRGLESAPLGEEVFGAPVDGDAVAFGASTLFLSSRRGGMAATFEVLPEQAVQLGTMTVTYEPVGASESVTQTHVVGWDGGTRAGEADDLGVYKIDALVHQYRAMLAAAEACDGERTAEEAVSAITHARSALVEVSAELEGDAALDREVGLMATLAALVDVEDGAALACAEADRWYY